MKKEESCGAILYTVENGKRMYVLIMEANGSYGFPKGHKNPGETSEETCLREVYEETGIRPELIKGLRRTIQYPVPSHNTVKEVIYFVARYENQELCPQDSDILSAKKYELEAAKSLLKFSQLKDILVEMDFMLELKGIE